MEKLSFADIKKLMELFNQLDIDHFKLKENDFEITFVKNKKRYIAPQESLLPVNHTNSVLPPDSRIAVQKQTNENIIPELDEENTDDKSIHIVKSPIIGTFYRSPAPNENAFVEVGTKVKKNDILCIIEAMKVMNKIESEINGEILEILVENEKPVEYGTPLFKIKIS